MRGALRLSSYGDAAVGGSQSSVILVDAFATEAQVVDTEPPAREVLRADAREGRAAARGGRRQRPSRKGPAGRLRLPQVRCERPLDQGLPSGCCEEPRAGGALTPAREGQRGIETRGFSEDVCREWT